jgi:truncated hemoglobin YjbI
MTTYQQVGGLKTFRRLARVFYARVTRDPLLRRLFPKKTDKQVEG